MRRQPAPGEVLAGRYRIERVIGEGGMGVVLEATHLHLDERVAIKMLLPQLLDDAALVSRFLSEGRASVKIRSEHVVRVHDAATLDDGTPYMVMEYLEGSDLGSLLEKNGPLPLSLTIDYVLQACEALAEAHSRDIVHRDIKPSNLFLAKRPDATTCIKVLDFGIAKIISATASRGLATTKTGALMGSPVYMAPEQMRGSPHIDARCDIWSLGVILYELLSGAPPFSASTPPELFAIVLRDEPPPLESARPDVPPEVARIVLKCLQKNPRDRFLHVGDFARALAPFGTDGARTSSERILRALGADPAPERIGATASRLEPAHAAPPRTESLPVATVRTSIDSEAARRPPRLQVVRWLGLGLVSTTVAASAVLLVLGRARAPARAAAAASGSFAASDAPPRPDASVGVASSPPSVLPALESSGERPRPAFSATAASANRPRAMSAPPPHAAPAVTTVARPPAPTPPGLATSRFE